MKINELNKNLSPNGEYFKVLKHLKKVAEAYRSCGINEKALFAGELEKFGALNINNSSGKFVICF